MKIVRRFSYWWCRDTRSPWAIFKWWYVRKFCGESWSGCWCDAVSWACGYDNFSRVIESGSARCKEDAHREGSCYCGRERKEAARG